MNRKVGTLILNDAYNLIILPHVMLDIKIRLVCKKSPKNYHYQKIQTWKLDIYQRIKAECILLKWMHKKCFISC